MQKKRGSSWSCSPRKWTSEARPISFTSCWMMRPLGAVADQEELGRDPLPDPGEDPDDVADPLDRAEVGGVHQDLLALRGEGGPRTGVAVPVRPVELDEIVDDPDLALDVEFLDRPLSGDSARPPSPRPIARWRI